MNLAKDEAKDVNNQDVKALLNTCPEQLKEVKKTTLFSFIRKISRFFQICIHNLFRSHFSFFLFFTGLDKTC